MIQLAINDVKYSPQINNKYLEKKAGKEQKKLDWVELYLGKHNESLRKRIKEHFNLEEKSSTYSLKLKERKEKLKKTKIKVLNFLVFCLLCVCLL